MEFNRDRFHILHCFQCHSITFFISLSPSPAFDNNNIIGLISTSKGGLDIIDAIIISIWEAEHKDVECVPGIDDRNDQILWPTVLI